VARALPGERNSRKQARKDPSRGRGTACCAYALRLYGAEGWVCFAPFAQEPASLDQHERNPETEKSKRRDEILQAATRRRSRDEEKGLRFQLRSTIPGVSKAAVFPRAKCRDGHPCRASTRPATCGTAARSLMLQSILGTRCVSLM
jgi:hypothetical protein